MEQIDIPKVALIGAFSFGFIIGWMLYFTNRYRSGPISFSDLGVLLGVIGGAAVTSLFGEAASPLFGYYASGVAFGFILYFLILLCFVIMSPKHDIGVFISGIDGSKKQQIMFSNFAEGKSTELDRLSSALTSFSGTAVDDGAADETDFSEVDEEVEQTIEELNELRASLKEPLLDSSLDRSVNDSVRRAYLAVTQQISLLHKAQAQRILSSDDVIDLTAALKKNSKKLKQEAARFKKLKDQWEKALEAAKKVLEFISKVPGV